jgi:mRNA interferase RelE/StbE
MTDPRYEVSVAETAERALARLPKSAAAAIVEFIVGPLCEAPRRLGHELRRELQGLWSARRGPYRVTYEIADEQLRVTVLRIDHAADVYRPR